MLVAGSEKRRQILLLVIVLSVLLGFSFGCAHNEDYESSDQSNETEQSGSSDAVSGVYYDYAYGADPLQCLDFVIPMEDDVKGLYVIIHGGAWISGDKKELRNSINNAAAHGYAVAAINYRFISESIHMNDILNDITEALYCIKDLAEEHNIKLQKAVFSGWSAGAHLSLLYSYKCASESPICPVAVISYCGPTDLTDPEFIENSELGDTASMLDLMNKLCGISISQNDYYDHTGNYKEWIDALQSYSPVYCVNEKSVPTVLGYGKKDTIVPFSNAVKLDQALSDNNVTHQFVVFPESGHNLDKDEESIQQMTSAESQYVQTYLN